MALESLHTCHERGPSQSKGLNQRSEVGPAREAVEAPGGFHVGSEAPRPVHSFLRIPQRCVITGAWEPQGPPSQPPSDV